MRSLKIGAARGLASVFPPHIFFLARFSTRARARRELFWLSWAGDPLPGGRFCMAVSQPGGVLHHSFAGTCFFPRHARSWSPVWRPPISFAAKAFSFAMSSSWISIFHAGELFLVLDSFLLFLQNSFYWATGAWNPAAYQRTTLIWRLFSQSSKPPFHVAEPPALGLNISGFGIDSVPGAAAKGSLSCRRHLCSSPST
jgi:hypothetical protein